ncbi:hypothetical protein Tco_1048641 [Tanacetum coccineum]
MVATRAGGAESTTQTLDLAGSREGTSNRGGGGTNQYERLTKLEFPKFNGEDVQGWLYIIHQFFLLDNIDDDAQRIRLAPMHVFDNALNWHKQFIKRFGGNVTWEMYETKVKRRFDSVFEDPTVELKNPKQNHFSVDDIGLAVRMFKPTNLADVYCLAKMQEATIIVTKSIYAALLATPKARGVEELGEDGDLILTKEGVVNAHTTSLIDEPPLISLNALSGVNTYKTMRVRGYAKKNVLHFQGITYTTDVMILPLGGCDLVLGIQWLSTLGWISYLEVDARETKEWGKNIADELCAMSVYVCPATFTQMKTEVADVTPRQGGNTRRNVMDIITTQ